MPAQLAEIMVDHDLQQLTQAVVDRPAGSLWATSIGGS